jgi:acyl-coenzyme A synthetase/AMP-(fatty) acid ligase
VVFGGFSSDALRDRLNDAEAKVLVTADGAYRRGSLLPMKHDADYALREAPTVKPSTPACSVSAASQMRAAICTPVKGAIPTNGR